MAAVQKAASALRGGRPAVIQFQSPTRNALKKFESLQKKAVTSSFKLRMYGKKAARDKQAGIN